MGGKAVSIDNSSFPSSQFPLDNPYLDSLDLACLQYPLDLVRVVGVQKMCFRDMVLNVLFFSRTA